MPLALTLDKRTGPITPAELRRVRQTQSGPIDGCPSTDVGH